MNCRSDSTLTPSTPDLTQALSRLGDVDADSVGDGGRSGSLVLRRTEDAGHLLGVVSRLRNLDHARQLARASIHFLLRAHSGHGSLHPRLDTNDLPFDDPMDGEATACAIWGLSQSGCGFCGGGLSRLSLLLLGELRSFRTPWVKAGSYAILAGTELITSGIGPAIGFPLVANNLLPLQQWSRRDSWPWTESRLTHANAIIPEALIAAGRVLEQSSLIDDGIRLLEWLLDMERSPLGHFSFSPTGGRTQRDAPRFDQRPIDAWRMASACAMAYTATTDPYWWRASRDAARWFAGWNDLGAMMWDPTTGDVFDRLTAAGPSPDTGIEATASLIGATLALEETVAGRNPRSSHEHRPTQRCARP